MNQSDMCPRFEKAVELLSKRWVALIVFQLLSGSQRFSEIEAALTNLSGRVLSERLKELEAAGIVKREVFAETPVRIEYSLTDMGRSLAPVFEEIAKWSSEWITLES
ncbi:helix-turn-helix transcriptional regulator [Bacillus altitudinis MN12]|jgi:DNA-binding HxlR family transcriptional regulator|uniref:Helix-turn-helix domain-containing protein n=3 Tax=Bacillus TaxID=1386 RepID=A0A5K1NBY6_BACAB|nr:MULTISPECIES: helix-turn-helix domain-containing protein [Bacillus]AHL72867.1 MarR family transcriptional regulator [Bacillus pumilus]EMI12915.1 transcriptional regulator [Bacillus stratosphericus LAMA 585]KML04626.1 MarR family transcriptional regulator [Bacillus stratosphericus]KQL42502.1 MarR family transcriptional regulator [Bacillus sp. FJAT-21955]MBW3699077.1 transcriptional regulator [Bacillus aerophilus]MDG3045293.1 helix-turn-helix domain-containing protein [Bacillus sp. B6(2022)]